MNKIDLITICISSSFIKNILKLGIKEKKAVYNDTIINIRKDDLDEVFRIIRNWDFTKGTNFINSERCLIKLYCNYKEVKTFYFNEFFPDNYINLKGWIRKLCKVQI